MAIRRNSGAQSSTKHETGFSLVEMLVALALLAAVATLMVAALQSFGIASKLLNRNHPNMELMAGRDFLKQLFAAARPIQRRWARAIPAKQLDGSSDSVAFVTSYVPAGQYQGLYESRIWYSRADGGSVFITQQLYRRSALSGVQLAPSKPLKVISGVASLRIDYLDVRDEQTRVWTDRWIASDRLPEAVRIDIAFHKEDSRTWKPLSVELVLGDD